MHAVTSASIDMPDMVFNLYHGLECAHADALRCAVTLRAAVTCQLFANVSLGMDQAECRYRELRQQPERLGILESEAAYQLIPHTTSSPLPWTC